MKFVFRRGVIGLLIVSLVAVAVSPTFAQPRPPYGRPPGPPGPPPRHHHHHGPSDFEKALGVVGAVGAVAAIANGYSPYGYYRHSRPVVVVSEPRPTTVVVEKTTPVYVDRPVIVEKPVHVTVPAQPLPADYYSPKLGATFKIQNMKIPGYEFTAARLTSNPVEGSPLAALGLVKGDVVTRLDNDPADSLDVLDRHEKNTLIRYIKTGTTKVRMGKIYIPTDAELGGAEDDMYYAP